MGTEALWVPLAVGALSAGAGAYNADRTARKQSAAATQGILQQQARQREATARVNQQIGAVERSTPEGERAAATDAYLAQLRANRAGVEGSPTLGGSDRFRADTDAAKVDIQNYGTNAAKTLASIDAPLNQRITESRGVGRAGVDLNRIAGEAQGDDFLNKLRMSQIRRNPWIDAASQIGTSYAKGAASRMKPLDPYGLSFSDIGAGRSANTALADAGFGG